MLNSRGLLVNIRQLVNISATQQKLKHTKIGVLGAPFDKGQVYIYSISCLFIFQNLFIVIKFI